MRQVLLNSINRDQIKRNKCKWNQTLLRTDRTGTVLEKLQEHKELDFRIGDKKWIEVYCNTQFQMANT